MTEYSEEIQAILRKPGSEWTQEERKIIAPIVSKKGGREALKQLRENLLAQEDTN